MPALMSTEVRDMLSLTLIPGVGPFLLRSLLERFGSPERVLAAPIGRLLEVPRIGHELAARIAAAKNSSDAADEAERVEKAGVRLLVMGSPEYPASLTNVSDAPHVIYCSGEYRQSDANAVALVGTRRCSSYGRRMTNRIATGLARAGICVVSGLARGVDGIAHRASLAAGGRTHAVLANGLCHIYPPEHEDLAREIALSGAVLTESRMRQRPQAGLFPARNRIISGLSRAVVVIEAGERSGALITARHAGEQGRTVLAVPGPADDESSGGCNALIRDGAIMCRGVDDILEELEGVAPLVSRHQETDKARAVEPHDLDKVQLAVWVLLEGGAKTLDEIAQQLQLGVPALSGTLMMLEMKRVVRRLPGNRYERC